MTQKIFLLLFLFLACKGISQDVHIRVNLIGYEASHPKKALILPSTLIHNIKELKARRLISQNPGIQMEMVAKNVGYSLSHLFLVLKNNELVLNNRVKILKYLKY